MGASRLARTPRRERPRTGIWAGDHPHDAVPCMTTPGRRSRWPNVPWRLVPIR